MTVKARYTSDGEKLIPVTNEQQVKRFLKKHPGEVFTLYLDNEQSNQGEALFLKFHALRDEYAAIVGHENSFAKIELKHLYGVTYPWRQDFRPPKRKGMFIQVYGDIEFQVSTTVYTQDELIRLVEGTQRAIEEAQV